MSHRCKSRNSFLWFIRDRLDACFWGGGTGYSKEGCAKLFVRRHTVESVHTETGWNIYAGFCLLSSCVQTVRGPPIVSIRTPELPHNTTSALSNLCLVSFYLRRIHPRICNYSGTSEVTRKADELPASFSVYVNANATCTRFENERRNAREKTEFRLNEAFSSSFFIYINVFKTCRMLSLQRDGKYNVLNNVNFLQFC